MTRQEVEKKGIVIDAMLFSFEIAGVKYLHYSTKNYWLFQAKGALGNYQKSIVSDTKEGAYKKGKAWLRRKLKKLNLECNVSFVVFVEAMEVNVRGDMW